MWFIVATPLRVPLWRCLDVECELRFLEYEHERRFSSGLPRPARQGGKRRCVQVDKRGSMIGRVKRQSGSEATKRPVFPEQGERRSLRASAR